MGTTISCRFSAQTVLLLMLVATPGRAPFAAAAASADSTAGVAPHRSGSPAGADAQTQGASKASADAAEVSIHRQVVGDCRCGAGCASARRRRSSDPRVALGHSFGAPADRRYRSMDRQAGGGSAARGRRRQDLRRRRRDAARTERRRRFERMESGSREAVRADSRARRLGHRRRWRIRDCPARLPMEKRSGARALEQSPSARRSTATASTCRSPRAA